VTISPVGCAAFAAAIPLFLLAGHLDGAAMRTVVKMRPPTRHLWLVLVAVQLFATLIALAGAGGTGLHGVAAWFVNATAVMAAIWVVLVAAARLHMADVLDEEDGERPQQ